MRNKLPKVLALWSGPRNVSTALMYSFAQRKDTQVLDEPFFGYFLKQTGVWRPSREEALLTMPTQAEDVHRSFSDADKPLLFVKNIANHHEGLDLESFAAWKNFFLIRHPRKVLASYTKQVQQPTELDLGYAHQLELLRFLKGKGLPYYVVDSDDILINPTATLEKLCTYLEIPFEADMLHWKAGALPEDGVWAKYWYHNVHKSTGFAPYVEREYSVPDSLNELLEISKKKYNQLKTYEQV
jgi:hypothetical protein